MNSSVASVFVSSRMEELRDERRRIREVLSAVGIDAWLYEADAGARPSTAEAAYLAALRRAEVFVGLYWKGHGPYTIEEFRAAQRMGKPCFLYERVATPEERDAELEKFLKPLRSVRAGLAIARFDTPDELGQAVARDVVRWLGTRARRAGEAREELPIYLADHFEQRETLQQALDRPGSLIVLQYGRSEQAHRTLSHYCYNRARAADDRVRELQQVRWPPAGRIEHRFDALCENILHALDRLETVERGNTASHAAVLQRLSRREDRPCFRHQLWQPDASDIRLLERALAEIWQPSFGSAADLLLIFEFVHSPFWFWQAPSWRRFRDSVRLLTKYGKDSVAVAPRIVNLSRSDVVRINAALRGGDPAVEREALEVYSRHHGRVAPTLKRLYEVEDEV